MDLQRLVDEKLIAQTKILVTKEREITSEVLKYLKEIDSRKLHLQRGYSSLWDFAIKYLGYSENEAHIRIQAMRLIRDLPETVKCIESGKLNLSVAAEANSEFKRQDIERRKKGLEPISLEEKRKVVHKLEFTSRREASVLLKSHFAGQSDEVFIEMRFLANTHLREKLKKLKGLLAHKNYHGDLASLIEIMADMTLREIEKKNAIKPNLPSRKKTNEAGNRSRHIAASLRKAIWEKYQGKCSYEDPVSGRKCESIHALEVDHIVEFSKGGKTVFENLRLLCSAHNKLRNYQAAEISYDLITPDARNSNPQQSP